MLLTLPDVPLRSDSFDLEDQWLFWSRVQMYPDRLEIKGWSFYGKHQRRIPLTRIEAAGYKGRRLSLDLEDGERVDLIVDEARRWAQFIQKQCDLRSG